MQFSVLWKFPGQKKSQSGHYEAPDLKSLLRMIDRSEDVSPATCDILIVHYHMQDGTTLEVVNHEKKGELVTTVMSDPKIHQLPHRVREENFGPLGHGTGPLLERIKQAIQEARNPAGKPRIKLKTPPPTPRRSGAGGLYTAYER